MPYCTKCGVHIRGTRRLCPLCQEELTLTPDEEPGGDIFPPTPAGPVSRRAMALFKAVTFACVAIVVLCLMVNAMVPSPILWSLIVLAGVGCMWLSFSVGLVKRKALYTNVLWQVTIVSVCAVIWDLCTGWQGWSLDFVLPGMSVLSIQVMDIYARVKRLPVQEYVVHLVINAFFGVIPIIFFFTGMLRVTYPSLICVGVSVISVSALLIFQGGEMTQELKRRFHL